MRCAMPMAERAPWDVLKKLWPLPWLHGDCLNPSLVLRVIILSPFLKVHRLPGAAPQMDRNSLNL